MQFVNPLFLYGLFAVSIPIIIHLFNFRLYRKVYFSNVNYLENIKKKTKRQSQLHHLLVLLMRILAVVAIVMAFARPYIPLSDKQKAASAKKIISIYVDNSFSMQAQSDRGTLLEKARDYAIKVADAYRQSDMFQLITNDFSSHENQILNREEVKSEIEKINFSPAFRTVKDIVARQRELSSKERDVSKELYLISDFQKRSLLDKLVETDANIHILPLEILNSDNLFIDSCWFEAPVHQRDQHSSLHVRIINSSQKDFEKIPIKLLVNGVQKSLGSFGVKANDETEMELYFAQNESGIQSGVIQIVDYPVTYDDDFYFSFDVSATINVLCINEKEENPYLRSLFHGDSTINYQFTQAGNIDYSGISQFETIILNGLKSISSGMVGSFKKYVSNGGKLVIFPPENQLEVVAYHYFLDQINASSYGIIDPSEKRISYIDYEHPIYKSVFDEIPENINLPVISNSYPIISNPNASQWVLLGMEDDSKFLVSNIYEEGSVFLFAASLEASSGNFPQHSLFVSTLYNIVALGSFTETLYYTIGQPDIVKYKHLNNGENIFKIKSLESDIEFIPLTKTNNYIYHFYPGDQMKTAGNYVLTLNDQSLKGISYNYNRNESYLDYYSSDDFINALKDIGIDQDQVIDAPENVLQSKIREQNEGVPLWRWFVLAALLFLGMEVILLRLFSRSVKQ